MGHLILGLVLLVYGWGAWKFWSGFRYTNFESGRFLMGLFWPVMLINGRYRKNFSRALRGR